MPTRKRAPVGVTQVPPDGVGGRRGEHALQGQAGQHVQPEPAQQVVPPVRSGRWRAAPWQPHKRPGPGQGSGCPGKGRAARTAAMELTQLCGACCPCMQQEAARSHMRLQQRTQTCAAPSAPARRCMHAGVQRQRGSPNRAQPVVGRLLGVAFDASEQVEHDVCLHATGTLCQCCMQCGLLLMTRAVARLTAGTVR